MRESSPAHIAALTQALAAEGKRLLQIDTRGGDSLILWTAPVGKADHWVGRALYRGPATYPINGDEVVIALKEADLSAYWMLIAAALDMPQAYWDLP
ncbi:MAG: hypothetical protein ACRBCL_01535 [Maritimibacter sp.]